MRTLLGGAATLVRAMLDISANGQIRRLLTGWTLGIAGDALFLVAGRRLRGRRGGGRRDPRLRAKLTP